ncbi:hypothetical protein FNV43_RR10147 [Rhamnella rubrinervis]|uniref:Neprosin PEP catalytic domain-containing protein n=1 Tax=Rhamnella rubrinervis TaxID=2594499 RepID=A0A8K0MKG7_9ROSA|nr:hypothetical protein FNV43_RR10147 [Rhamnella rubrinervis]
MTTQPITNDSAVPDYFAQRWFDPPDPVNFSVWLFVRALIIAIVVSVLIFYLLRFCIRLTSSQTATAAAIVAEVQLQPQRVPVDPRGISRTIYPCELPYEEKICACCQYEFAAGDTVSTIPSCGHSLHSSCFDDYMLILFLKSIYDMDFSVSVLKEPFGNLYGNPGIMPFNTKMVPAAPFAQEEADVSGVLAVMTLGMIAFKGEGQQSLHHFWGMVAYIAKTFIFIQRIGTKVTCTNIITPQDRNGRRRIPKFLQQHLKEKATVKNEGRRRNGFEQQGISYVQAISNGKKSHGTIVNEPKHISVPPNTQNEDFDCVDIYKQPAFDHPLLKNHKIQLNPSFSDRLVRTSESVGEINVQSKGCLSGMVPIQRSKTDSQFGHQFTMNSPGEHFATFDTNTDATYHGASALINIYNPSVAGDQYSMAQIWLQSGPALELNSIQAGWAVDGFKNTGCYNALCPGFVQIDSGLRPGQEFQNTSTRGGAQTVVELHILQEQSSGNWWLITQNNVSVGYWPKELFGYLNSGADIVRYGGTTKALAQGVSPPMGSGTLPSNDYHQVDYFAQVKIVNDNFTSNDIVEADFDANIDTPTSCYDLRFFANQGGELGQTFSFGGPGGASCGA